MVNITVFRYGHRIVRDKRITTHLALVARAFGADGIIIDKSDENVEKVVERVNQRFGGSFTVSSGKPWQSVLSSWKGIVVHLTMYGQPLSEVVEQIKEYPEILVMVGSQKVPGAFYEKADLNVAIGNQPHSEVAALAIFLDRILKAKWHNNPFLGPINVVPQKRGKRIMEQDFRRLLEEAGCPKRVIKHAEKVQRLAMAMCDCIQKRGITINRQIVSAGALLHDIGRSRTHDIHHVTKGASIIRELNLPKAVIDIVERHAGAGIDKYEATKLGLPPKDYTPKTLEEEIVAHADNLTGTEYRTVQKAILKIQRQAGERAAQKVADLHEKLSRLCGQDIDKIVKELI